MREVDVDLSERRPRPIDPEVTNGVDVVVTMGCGDECPYIPGAAVVDWEVEDPGGRTLDEVREIRDDIGSRIDELLGAELLLGQ